MGAQSLLERIRIMNHTHEWQRGSGIHEEKMFCIDCGQKKQWIAGNWQTVKNFKNKG